MTSTHFAVFGPTGRRITNLAASPNGRYLVCRHVPQNYYTADYHELFFRQAGDTYVEAGALPEGLPSRHNFAPLDDGGCLVLETDDDPTVYLARYESSAGGMAEVARWVVDSPLSLSDASLRLLPSGREALVFVTDRDDKQVDWGGGAGSGLYPDMDADGCRVRCDAREDLLGQPREAEAVAGCLPRFAWRFGAHGTRAARECEALQKIILPLAWKALESAIHAGRRHLLTSKRVIEIASGETLLNIHEDPHADRFGTPPRFHDLSPDESYVLSTGEGGHFELRNVASQGAWRPALPAHGGVHTASFLPGGRAVLGTAQGGVIVVNCAQGIAPGDTPWGGPS